MMTGQTLKLKIKTMEKAFSAKEIQIASFILSDPKRASRMTINEMSEQLSMADSTIFKFTRKLGYQGFRSFRNDLLLEDFDREVSIHEHISECSGPCEIAASVFDSSIKSLTDTKAMLEEADIVAAADLIIHCERLSFYGMGGSSIVAADGFHKFMRTPIDVRYEADFHLQLMEAARLTDRDCAIAISHSGCSKQTIDIATMLEKRGCPVIAITSNPASALARASTVALVTISEETGYRSESLSSRISQLALIDTLYTMVMLHDEERSKHSLQLVREAIGTTRVER
ncbi:transcriptional regulator, RpiR family [Coriobacterium glomerans PW2]|uniref:Transcriptional regulator, RpiR family n=1 Tax=Coriobacterium glomerans (strain ATCC 49209 / DSM 20642 / JCM 10262 / PW2) TaxID=700015 RepID=F2N913_CORGP|nr:MurR/RpiR family transcriptional regulator [Coriobacterium glomerans]AEB07613.1 transcriptional regulator, RpiR family [Coriobacterium glomerans PW2]